MGGIGCLSAMTRRGIEAFVHRHLRDVSNSRSKRGCQLVGTVGDRLMRVEAAREAANDSFRTCANETKLK